MGETRWMSTREAAKRLRMHPGHVRVLIRTGRLPAVRAGTGRGIYRITEHAVEAFRRDRNTTDPAAR